MLWCDARVLTSVLGPGWPWVLRDFVAGCNFYQGHPKPTDEGTAAQRQFYVYDAWNRLMEVWKDTNTDGDKDTKGNANFSQK